ncbi:hypothetical protein NQZ68_015794 [Dissostichus eleginoides]|nr:hypothetical protein NQZ68_015794 [Dissostichus eleginoides]
MKALAVFALVCAMMALVRATALSEATAEKDLTAVKCLLQVDKGPCKAYIGRYYYNTITQKCEIFYYGGCQGNANNFRSYQECQKSCFRIPKVPQICRLPKEKGPCRAHLSRYFFNTTTMQCEPFYYGGCEGNSNRFQDLKSCKESCSPKKSVPVLCPDPLL